MKQTTSRDTLFFKLGWTAFKLVHQGRRHQLYRGIKLGRRFVFKSTAILTPQAIASLRHEYEILHGIDFLGIVRVEEQVDIGGYFGIVMEDAGATNLAEHVRTGPLHLTEFLEVAIQLAEAVARMHAAKIIHRHVNPFNAVWDPETRKATLVDFGMATTLSSLTVENINPSQIEGTPFYISPEQTGRTGRAVDSRTDLYSLGTTFYQLLIGLPPFVSQDPIELIHGHLARRPTPPHSIDSCVPQALSDIILKLLEKEPEQRYQTAEALAIDLREAREQWSKTSRIVSFPLACHDIPDTLRIPDKLYGRAVETQVLREAFNRAVSGNRELVLITGAPGIGKSALVNQMAQPVIEQRGIFIVGKFDQLQRGIPYRALVQAFRTLVRQLLTEPVAVLGKWKQNIQAAVTPNGQVLIDVIPELEGIIGQQPSTPELGPVEAKNRFVATFTSFLRIFAQPEHPFVLFLDDLQWADAASLRLIEQWTLDDATCHFLLLAAYRDGEVDATHPFAVMLKELKEQKTRIHKIHLEPLVRENVAKLLTDTFNRDSEGIGPFAATVPASLTDNLLRWV